jgi:hypothetical protein
VFQEDDTTRFHVFDVTGLTEAAGYFQIDVTYVAGNSSFADAADIIMSLAVTGDAGDTGATGPQGDTGTAGAQGDTGVQGDTGTTGAQGDTGTTGAQGDTGIQGDTGAQGTQGDTGTTGVQGDTGAQGDTGVAGSQGDTGVAGAQGDTGVQGEFGGYSAPFNFDTATAMSNPGGGDLRYNNATMSLVTALAVSDTDADSNGVDAFLDQISDGLIRVFSEASGATEWTYFTVTGVTDNGVWHQIDVTYIASAGGDPPHTNGEGVVLTYSPSGEQGDTGSAGAQGDTGVAGSQGDTGIQGDTGVTGAQGDTGTTGAQGDTGATGAQGDTGVQGDTGAQGIQGDTGATGSQGDTGIQGDTGAGTQGDTGATGDTGTAGTSATSGYSITVENPDASEDISISFTNRAITITEMRAVLIGASTPSVTWTIRHHATDRSNAGNEVVTGGTTTTSTTTGSDVTAFNDATIPADSFIWLETTAQSGTVTEIHITIVYTVD